MKRTRTCFVFLLALGMLDMATALADTPGTFSATGNNMGSARFVHTATLLPSGKVLIAGGSADGGATSLNSADLFDPGTGMFTPTSNMGTARLFHVAVRLPNGKVLVAGGRNGGTVLNSSELYDPTTGMWAPTGNLNTGRYQAEAVLLPNGKVLVAGGYNFGNLTSAELYDPATGMWTATGSMAADRLAFGMTLLPNGKVLISAGGRVSGLTNLAELFDPAANGGIGAFSATNPLNAIRADHTATLLPNGKVLIAGGNDNAGTTLASAELYDPATGAWSLTGSMNSVRRSHAATLLPSGKVLITGGQGAGAALASAELYDPATGTFTSTGSLATARSSHRTVLLPTGKVLLAGGYNSGALASAELYCPEMPGTAGTWTATGSISVQFVQPAATLLTDGSNAGKVLVAGTILGGAVSAVLYDSAAGTWTTTGTPVQARHAYTITHLPNGKVLAAGGYPPTGGFSNTAELYDPATGTWALTGNLATARGDHSATLLTSGPNAGKVLVAGGGIPTA
jgi:WD40 repeat protein